MRRSVQGAGRALLAAAVLALAAGACRSVDTEHSAPEVSDLQVGFLVLDGVYGSELVAPHDVFHHTVFHAEPSMDVLTIGRTRQPIRTFEGLVLTPDFSLRDAPSLDVLVVPSAEHNMDSDLEDEALIEWVRRVGSRCQYIVSLCDGAFVLAEAGLLDDHACTTFPGDLDAFVARYPELDTRRDVSFVADGHVVTSAGGAASYDAAMWLVQHLYGTPAAEGVGRGLVIDWDLTEIPHTRIERPESTPATGR